jgi:phage terminase small subunit
VPGSLSVTPASLTVTADNKTKLYGAALPALTASYLGFVNGDTANSLTTRAVLNTTATITSHFGSYPITANGVVDADYTFNYVPGSLSVTPVSLTVTADNKTKLYGAALPALTASYLGFVNGDTANSLTTRAVLNSTATAASHFGSYPITASGVVDTDYAFNYVPGSLSVTPVSLTVTADNKTKLYGAALPALTASYLGFVNGDTVNNLTTRAVLNSTATAASHFGSYPITASGVVDTDYTFNYVPGSLSVTTASLTVTADSKTKLYGAALPALTASYLGFVNGDTASSLTTQPNFSTTATAASPVATYPITTSGAVDPDYTISYLPGSMNVTPAPLTIKADDKSKIARSANPPLTFTATGFVNGDTASKLTTQPILTTTATASSSAGTYSITASGAAILNYTISYLAGTLTVTSAASTSISGKEYFDITGNGLTTDDTPLAGVTVYLDTNNNGSWNTGEPFATTLADGSYAMTSLAAGTYKVREVVPTGYVRTGPATSDYYSVTLSSGQSAGGNNFANAALGNLSVLTNVVYLVNGVTPVSDLRGATHEGDTIQVSFTVVAGTQPQRFTLASYTAPGATYDANTAAQQQIFDSDMGVFGPGTYTLTVSNPHSYFQVDFVSGYAIDKLGPAASNIFYSAQNRLFSADNGGTHAVLTSPASLTGTVYLDSNNNGNMDTGERPIAGVTVTLTCGSTPQSVVTDIYGVYTFDNLPASAYTITESQPNAYSDGKDTLGNKGGTVSNDKFSGINLAAGAVGTGYNFGEQQTVGSAFAGNQTQTTVWWSGSNGQALIKALNSGQNSTNLGNWLASNFNNLFGADAGSANNLAGKTNAQVATYYQSLYANMAKKPEADALALALNTYVTNSSLAGNTAASYGFAVSSTGLGGSTANVGVNGAAFGINDNTVMTITELLSRANARARKGTLWDSDGDGVLNSAETILRNQVYSLFDAVNNA